MRERCIQSSGSILTALSLAERIHQLFVGQLRLPKEPGQRPGFELAVKRHDAADRTATQYDMTSALPDLYESNPL